MHVMYILIYIYICIYTYISLSLKPLIHISFRCEVPRLPFVEGQSSTMFKPHILKHHIPELPQAEVAEVLARGRG